MSLKNSNDTIGNRTRDLPVCSVAHIRIILCNNYIFIICINDNNAAINNYGNPQELILLFMTTWKDLFEIYRQLGHAPSKWFSNPGLTVTLHAPRFNVQKFYIVFTMCSCVLRRTRNKQQHLPYSALTDWFWITEVESLSLIGTVKHNK